LRQERTHVRQKILPSSSDTDARANMDVADFAVVESNEHMGIKNEVQLHRKGLAPIVMHNGGSEEVMDAMPAEAKRVDEEAKDEAAPRDHPAAKVPQMYLKGLAMEAGAPAPLVSYNAKAGRKDEVNQVMFTTVVAVSSMLVPRLIIKFWGENSVRSSFVLMNDILVWYTTTSVYLASSSTLLGHADLKFAALVPIACTQVFAGTVLMFCSLADVPKILRKGSTFIVLCSLAGGRSSWRPCWCWRGYAATR